MQQLGFVMSYYPAGIPSDRGMIIFEVKTYEEGKATRWTEVLECEFDMPPGVEMEAPEIPWMLHILAEATSMANDAAVLGEEPSTDPAVVKAALATGKKLLAD